MQRKRGSWPESGVIPSVFLCTDCVKLEYEYHPLKGPGLRKQGHCFPERRYRIPGCDTATPFAITWLGLGLAKSTTHRVYLTLQK